MGREALVDVEINGEASEAKALLESDELILRGGMRRRFLKADITSLAVDGEALRFQCRGEAVCLHLGGDVAESWAKAIALPPPSLRTKLGLGNGATAIVLGDFDDDDALRDAVSDATTAHRADAAMIIACIKDAGDLASALDTFSTGVPVPVWAVYPKGKGVAFGDAAIRTTMRSHGFRDTKACAVSVRLTATRYNRR